VKNRVQENCRLELWHFLNIFCVLSQLSQRYGIHEQTREDENSECARNLEAAEGATGFNKSSLLRSTLDLCQLLSSPAAGATLGTAELATPLTWQVWHGLSVVFPRVAVRGAQRPEVKGAVGHHEAQAIGFVDVGGAQRAILQ